jgi:predicted PurR-regulated permease PerM
MRHENYFFVVTLCVAFLGAFLLIYPFLHYLFFALLLTYLLHPLKRALEKEIKSRTLAAFILIFLVILVIIAPTIYISSRLVKELRSAVSMVAESPNRHVYLEKAESYLERFTGEPVDLHLYKNELISQVRGFLVKAAPNVLGSVSGLLLGLFIMFFVMFYSFQEGRKSFEHLHALIPLAPNLKDKLFDEIKSVTWAVVYGQIMTAIIQGGLGGVGFLIFGVPNPILWGSVMVILSFLPILGTALIWVPAGIYLIASGAALRGIGLLIYGGVLVANVDNFLKPRLIAGKSNIHPVVVLLGVLGGLKVFGFIGLFAGPLILALLIALLRFYESEEYLELRNEG